MSQVDWVAIANALLILGTGIWNQYQIRKNRAVNQQVTAAQTETIIRRLNGGRI
jgi:hypothetical protein